jgi:hypothetical protein
MKTKAVLVVFLVSLIYLFNACKDSDSPGQPNGDPEVDDSYFPAGDGSSYKYDIERTNGSQEIGERSSRYSGTETKNGTNYQRQQDSVTIAGQTRSSLSFFRKTDTGVFFFIDTTGLSSAVPDSLLQYLTLDTEMRLLFLPIEDGTNWTAFRININYLGIFNFNPVEVNAVYEGKENLTLNLDSGSQDVEAARIKFILRYQIDPFGAPVNFEAYNWFAKSIGIVKWEGNGTIIGAFTGGGINFDDSTSIIMMNITDYNIN